MGVALTIREYLDDNHIPFGVMRHHKTATSAVTAMVARVEGDNLAKGVVLKWDDGYVLAVLPASRHLDMARMREMIGGEVRLATEDEASMLFPDCETGAVPALGVPYRVSCIIDDELEGREEIYFEGGDHKSLVHLAGDEFGRLMYGMPHARICE